MRAFHFPGVFFLFCAFILTLVTSVSLPYLRTVDIARTHFGELQVVVDNNPSDQLRLGVWAYCHYLLNGDRVCSSIGYAYSVHIVEVGNQANISIDSAWTRGLAVHPVSVVVTLAALLVSLFPNNALMLLIASVLSLISMFLCFIGFLVDVALFGYLKFRVGAHGNGLRTLTGPGVWINFAAMILTGFAMCSLFIGRRIKMRDEGVVPVTSTAEKSTLFERLKLRRNKGQA